MKILIAPNAFKGTITADEAAELIGAVIQSKISESEIILQPLADGGDGTCRLLIQSLGLERISLMSLDAIGRPIEGDLGWDSSSKRVYLDVSTASGLGVLDENQKKADLTSTFGTGILIQKAIEMGAKEIILGLGGSATVDLGLGILQSFGFIFLDENGRDINPFTPDFLSRIRHIQRPPRLPKIKFTCLCDVNNHFFGAEGAIPVFGPQKGIKLDDLEEFETECRRVLEMLIRKTKIAWEDREGFGAAGGIALGLDLFFPVEIKFGANYFFDVVNLEEKVQNADWILTGEGRFDSQSAGGKACYELLQLCVKKNKNITLITSGNEGFGIGFDEVLVLPDLDFTNPNYKKIARENLHELTVHFCKNRISS